MSAASEEIREFLRRLNTVRPNASDPTFLDKIEALLAERDELLTALEASYVVHRRTECPTDTTQQDHNWQNHKGVECTCTAFDPARAAIAKSRGA